MKTGFVHTKTETTINQLKAFQVRVLTRTHIRDDYNRDVLFFDNIWFSSSPLLLYYPQRLAAIKRNYTIHE